jgi:DNA polymerase III subunit epsilon
MSDQFVFFDFETTGLDPSVDRVIEIGAIRCTLDGEEIAYYSQLVNPGIPVPAFITQLTGITTAMLLQDGMPPADAIRELLEFSGTTDFVAFNAEFDREFLLAEAGRIGISSPTNTFHCALDVARRAWPVFKKHNLNALSMFFGLLSQEHRALGDSRLGAKIFLKAANAIWEDKIVERIKAKNIQISAVDIENLHSCSDGDLLMLWSHPTFPKINAYAPNSMQGSGLVLAMIKEENEVLVEQFNAGRITFLKVAKAPGQPYEVHPHFNESLIHGEKNDV